MSIAQASTRQTLTAAVQRLAVAATLFAVGLLCSVPFVVPTHRYPLTTFDAEWMAAIILAIGLIFAAVANRARIAADWSLPAIGLLLVAIGFLQYQMGMLHYTYALTSLVMFVCLFVAAYLLGRWLVAADLRTQGMRVICIALVAGGVVSVLVQVLQVLDVRSLPPWLVFPNVANLSNRRAYGNLAQPNQLATYLIWATLAALYLINRGAPKALLHAAAGVFFAGVALTGSRMGSLFCLLVVGLVLARTAGPATLRERVRFCIVLAVGYAAGVAMIRYFLVDAAGAMSTAIERYGEGSFGQRLSMWLDALRIAWASPWLGVGVGEYGGAQYWFAASGPDLMPTNNPHNVFLHVAAEFGVPAMCVVAAIVVGWGWQRRLGAARDAAVTTALVLLFFMLVHSLLEYPLWHLHFLVVTAVLVGLAEPARSTAVERRISAWWSLAPIGIATVGTALIMRADYGATNAVWEDYLRDAVEGRGLSEKTMMGVLGSRNLTYFKPQMERLYVDLLPTGPTATTGDTAVSARVLTRLADVGVVERHIVLLVQAGRIEESYPHIERLKVFAGSAYPTIRARIEESIAAYGAGVDPVRRLLAAP